MKKYRIDVYIVDDHTMLNEGLTKSINQSEKVHVSRSFTTLAMCRQALMERCPDVLLLDISMPDGDGITFCQWVSKEFPKVKIVTVTIHDEYSVIQKMLANGVHGYVLKSSSVEELIKAIVSVWQGKNYLSAEVQEIIKEGSAHVVSLTPVEHHILRHICEGMTNPEIAAQLNLSVETINWYRKRLLAKYGVKNTVTLVRVALEQKLV